MGKFTNSQVGKKIIIFFVIILLFNFMMPKRTEAVDVGGILLKPFGTFCNYILSVVDIQLSLFLQGRDMSEDLLNTIITKIKEIGEEDGTIDDSATLDSGEKLSDFFIGPDSIFCGKVAIFDANIFEAVDDSKFELDDIGLVDLASQLRKTVAGLYVMLRNLGAIVMLIGLLYTGIRILISSNMPAKSSQWVSMIQDWLIGLILLIFSHVIIISIFHVSDMLVNAIRDFVIGRDVSFVQEIIFQGYKSWDGPTQIIYLIMLGYLLYLTIIFSWSYFKRLFWICLLIIISPVVSVMYAFGKGTKDIYMNWLKELLGAILVQPFHLLMYFVLVSIPIGVTSTAGGGFSDSNPFSATLTSLPRLIYGLIAMGMIRPFEKYLTHMFKMDKGLATVASREYGEKDIKAKAKKVEKGIKFAEKAVTTLGVAVATGGASLGASLGATAASTATATTAAAETGTALAETGTVANEVAEADAIAGVETGAPGLGPSDDASLNGIVNDIKPGNDNLPEQNLKGINTGINEEESSTMMVDGLGSIIVGNVNSASITGNIDNNDSANNNTNNTEHDTENNNNEVSTLENVLSAEESKGKIGDWIDRGKNVMNSSDLRDSFADYREASLNAAELNYITPGGVAGSGGDLSTEKDLLKSYREKTKEKKEKGTNSFVNKPENIAYVMKEDHLIEKCREKYRGKPEAYIEDKAKTEAKDRLEKMAVYANMGFTDIGVISQLYNKQKETGMSPDEVVKSTFTGIIDEKVYNSFNSNENIITKINNELGTSATDKVEQAIPNSQEYWKAGFRTTDSQIHIEKLAKDFKSQFGTTMEDSRKMALKKAKMESNNTTVAIPKKPENRSETEMEKTNRAMREWLNKGNRDGFVSSTVDKVGKNVVNKTAPKAKKIFDKGVEKFTL